MPTTPISAAMDTAGVDKLRLRSATAAKDFEALLVGQMLKSVREEGSGWLGTGDDQSSAAAFGLAEEHLAQALSARGGFGLSKVIEPALNKPSAE